MRNTKAYGSYSTNPYADQKQTQYGLLFAPDAYSVSELISLSARAIRVLLVIASRVDMETGISYCPTKELRLLFSGQPCNISAAKTELLRAKLVAYGRANHSFYVNPKAFKPLTIIA